MVKNTGNNQLEQEINQKRKDLLQQQKETGKSFSQMIDEIDDEINELGKEKSNLIIKYPKNQIEDIDKEIKKIKEEKKKYASAWISYVDVLKYYKFAQKTILIIMGIIGVFTMAVSLIITKDFSLIPITIAYVAGIDICFVSVAKIYTKIITRKHKLKYFNNKNITEEEMQEKVKEKEKTLNSKWNTLDESKEYFVNNLQEINNRIDQITKKQQDLAITKKILMQEALKNTPEEENLDLYLTDEIKEYKRLVSEKFSKNEEKPKVQRKRFKVVGRKIN